MKREEIFHRILAVEPKLRLQGVAALYLFGSRARDEARHDSDVDLFVDPADEASFGLMPLMETLTILEAALPGLEIGCSTRDGIVPCYRPYIEKAALRVFG